MLGLGERFGTLIIATALLFAALRIHKSSGKHSRITKPFGLIVAFLSGCTFLITFVGGWMRTVAGVGGAVGVAGLIVCVAILAIDWLADGKPDKPAFWAAFLLAMFVVFGVSQIPHATSQVGRGASQVGSQMSQIGK